jgi:signal transduction protein with GAF and PtsI domain
MENVMSVEHSAIDHSPFDFLHEIVGRRSTSDGLHELLDRVVEFVMALVKCDSCLIYVVEGDQLVLRASKNARPDMVDRAKLRVGQGIATWTAEHNEPVAIHQNASRDLRFQVFHELAEDTYEAFLSVPLICRGRLVGTINLQNRRPHIYKSKDIRVISAIGILVGAEVELTRVEEINSELTGQLETRKLVERAKGILQRELHLNEEQAYLALQRQSRQKRKPMKEIAEAIILGEELKRENSSLPNRSSVRSSGNRLQPTRSLESGRRSSPEGFEVHHRASGVSVRRPELRLTHGEPRERRATN